ncbi:MAG: serine/threonine protein phosphatase [Hyphomonas sp.]|nr:serine/threonine protein phosphatase [Hyphomonas sp.]
MTGELICAIGDIHGEAGRLDALHAAIFDHHRLLYPEARLTLVHLGDYVDRGPDSCGVIETLMKLEGRDDLTSICLKGNHEEMMLDALIAGETDGMWMRSGGAETMASYHRRDFPEVPKGHRNWLKSLPVHHILEDRKLLFVHAGIAPGRWPELDEQVALWTRARRFFDVTQWDNPALEGWTVVHGHTPTGDFCQDVQGDPPRRINIDTGAVYGGKLTAALFGPGGGGAPVFLHA